MNSYKYAKTTPKSRELIIDRYTSGQRQQAIADALGISRRTVCKWVKRWNEEGDAGLQNRSSRPTRSPNKLAEACEDAILQARRTKRLVARKISAALSIPLSTVSAVLKRNGAGRLIDLEPKPEIIRYEKDAPGDLIHIDIKKVGIISGVGHRFTGGKRRNHAERRKNGTGYEYVHAAVDDHSRFAYVEILPDETAKTSAGFLLRALRFFKKNGFSVLRVMTDNGPGYVSKLYARTLKRLRIKHKRTKPYTPKTNGKVERFNRIMKDEWLYQRPYTSSEERENALFVFLDFYNNFREHGGIGYRTPASRL